MEKGPENTRERTFHGVSLREIYEVIHLLPIRELLPPDLLETSINEWEHIESLSKIGLGVKWEKGEEDEGDGERESVVGHIPHLEIVDEQELHEFFSWLFEILKKPRNANEMDIAARVYRTLFDTIHQELSGSYGSSYFEAQFQLYTFFSEHIITYLDRGYEIFGKKAQKEFLQKEESDTLMIQPLVRVTASLFQHYENFLEGKKMGAYRKLYAEFVEAVLHERKDKTVEEKGVEFLRSLQSSNQLVQEVWNNHAKTQNIQKRFIFMTNSNFLADLQLFIHNLERILILEERRVQAVPINNDLSIGMLSRFTLSKKRAIYVDAIRREMQKIYQKGFEFHKSISTFIRYEMGEG